jgi:hypothetical protein
VYLIVSHLVLSPDFFWLDLLYPLWVVYTLFVCLLGQVLAPSAFFVFPFLFYALLFAKKKIKKNRDLFKQM